jgi:hypothetical protein
MPPVPEEVDVVPVPVPPLDEQAGETRAARMGMERRGKV